MLHKFYVGFQVMNEGRNLRRAAMLERLADHMLAAGLAGSSLRALAAACHTSDRMLLYYFADKDALIVAALQAISLRLATVLEAALPAGVAVDPDTVLGQLADTLLGEALRPYMRLWLELAALSARGEEPYRSVSGEIADGFAAWIAGRLGGADAPARAARLLAILDGAVLLDAVGRPGLAGLALGRGAR